MVRNENLTRRDTSKPKVLNYFKRWNTQRQGKPYYVLASPNKKHSTQRFQE